jgi:predicted DNA-binding ribbon-helix-helix protein
MPVVQSPPRQRRTCQNSHSSGLRYEQRCIYIEAELWQRIKDVARNEGLSVSQFLAFSAKSAIKRLPKNRY